MFELFDHTADVGLRVRAGDLDALFADAGRGLFSLIVEDLGRVQPLEPWDVMLEAGAIEDLFFDFLDELLYTFESRHLVLCEFSVRVDGTRLAAQGRGQVIDPLSFPMGREVKAITYHGLIVRREENGWLAEVIVDI